MALALEPREPGTHCERFFSDQDRAACALKIEKQRPDWYAAAACAELEDDKNFMTCLDEIQGASFQPEALELCSQPGDGTDELRLSCYRKIKNQDYPRAQIQRCSDTGKGPAIVECLEKQSRLPAASKKILQGFQSLEIRK